VARMLSLAQKVAMSTWRSKKRIILGVISVLLILWSLNLFVASIKDTITIVEMTAAERAIAESRREYRQMQEDVVIRATLEGVSKTLDAVARSGAVMLRMLAEIRTQQIRIERSRPGSSDLPELQRVLTELERAIAQQIAAEDKVAEAHRQIAANLNRAIEVASKELPKRREIGFIRWKHVLVAFASLLVGIIAFALSGLSLHRVRPGHHFSWATVNQDKRLQQEMLGFLQYNIAVITSFGTTEIQPVSSTARALACVGSILGIAYLAGIVAIALALAVS